MKKFLIAVICIIPIVAVLALSVTSNIILLTTPVNPESIVVKNSRNEEIAAGELITVDINTEDFLIIEVYPSMTPDKSILQERDEGAGSGSVELVPIEGTNRYRIRALEMGATDLIIRASKNINVVFTLHFYVTTTEIASIDIYNGEGAEIAESAVYSLKTTEQFYYDINPMAALHESNVEWISGNSGIVSVSVNGTVTPVSRGITTVTLAATDREGNHHRRTVYVDTSEALVKKTEIYVADGVRDIDELIRMNVVTGEDVSVSGIERLSDDRYAVEIVSGGELTTVEIGVIYCAEDEWGFTDGLTTIYTQNGPYYATFGYLISGEAIEDESLTLVSDDTDVLGVEIVETISGGKGFELKPVKAGVVTLTAEYNGHTVSKIVTVRERPVSFTLELTTADAARGIQMSRIWGTEWLDENNEPTNTFRLGIVGDSNSFDVRWSVSTEGLEEGAVQPVSVAKEEGSQAALITVDPVRALGKNVTLTATLMVNNRPVDVRRSFTFRFHKLPAFNTYDFEDVLSAIDLGSHDIVMQGDAYATNDVRAKTMRSGIYGNGFLFDFSAHRPTESQSTEFVFEINGGTHFAEGQEYAGEVYTDGFVFEDIVMRGALTLDDAGKTSHLIRARDVRNSSVTYRYCQIYNTTRGLQAHSVGDLTVEGCILGDNYTSGIELGYYREDAKNCHVTLRNNVFKMSYGASVQIVPRVIDANNMNRNIIPNITIEGIMDVYNWKTTDEVYNILTTTVYTMVPALQAASSLLDGPFATAVNEMFAAGAFDGLIYNYGGAEYVSIAGFGLGLMCSYDLTGVTVAPETGMRIADLAIADSDTIRAIANIASMLVDGLTINHDCFLICADFTSGPPLIEPGDQIPNDQTLYDRLTGSG